MNDEERQKDRLMKIQFIQNLINVSTQNQPFCLFDVMQGK